MSIVIDQVRREASNLLDAGAGVGSLTSAFFDQALQNGTAVDAETWEIDNTLGGSPPFTWLDVAAKGEFVFLPHKENLLQAVQ